MSLLDIRVPAVLLRLLSLELRALPAPGADGPPEMGPEFESSYPGLFPAGLITAAGFGPAMRFVHGATFTAGRLVRGIRRRLRGAPPHLPPAAATGLVPGAPLP